LITVAGLGKTLNVNLKKGCFHILFWKVLPYKVPIAAQTMLALMSDMEGADVNYVFDDSPNIRMQNMHLCVFPLSDCSVVMAFYHKRDRYYKGLLHQFHSITDGKKLKYLNWLTFRLNQVTPRRRWYMRFYYHLSIFLF